MYKIDWVYSEELKLFLDMVQDRITTHPEEAILLKNLLSRVGDYEDAWCDPEQKVTYDRVKDLMLKCDLVKENK